MILYWEVSVSVKLLSCVQLFATPCTIQTMEFSSQNTWVGSLSLLQGIFPTQGSNPSLPHLRQILYQLSHEGSPRILEWVAHPFSSGSSQFRNWTGVSCTAGKFFTNWATPDCSWSQWLYTNLFRCFKNIHNLRLIPNQQSLGIRKFQKLLRWANV